VELTATAQRQLKITNYELQINNDNGSSSEVWQLGNDWGSGGGSPRNNEDESAANARCERSGFERSENGGIDHVVCGKLLRHTDTPRPKWQQLRSLAARKLGKGESLEA